MRFVRHGLSARERCIVALDVPSADAALRLVAALGEGAVFFKVGLELFAAGEGRGLVGELRRRGRRVFVDLKLYDVPETVARATRRVVECGADFLTVHGDEAIMRAAVAARGEAPLRILAVTALTSLDEEGLRAMGFAGTMRDFVTGRALRAQEAGCDGVVCSGWEVAAVREVCGDDFLVVVPGVRPAGVAVHDQKRTATPAAVVAAGGDFVVVGRPVRDAGSPRLAFEEIVAEVGG